VGELIEVVRSDDVRFDPPTGVADDRPLVIAEHEESGVRLVLERVDDRIQDHAEPFVRILQRRGTVLRVGAREASRALAEGQKRHIGATLLSISRYSRATSERTSSCRGRGISAGHSSSTIVSSPGGMSNGSRPLASQRSTSALTMSRSRPLRWLNLQRLSLLGKRG
jgi:hypothetical protein